MLGIHPEACFPQVRGKGQNRLPDARADACSLQLVSGKGNGGACGWVPRVGSRVLSPPPDGLADIGLGSDSVCARPSSHRIKSFDSLGPQPAHGRTSQLFQGQYRSLVSVDVGPGGGSVRWAGLGRRLARGGGLFCLAPALGAGICSSPDYHRSHVASAYFKMHLCVSGRTWALKCFPRRLRGVFFPALHTSRSWGTRIHVSYLDDEEKAKRGRPSRWFFSL